MTTARQDYPAEPIAASGRWSIHPNDYKRMCRELDDWRANFDKRVREACLKAGLDQGREEQVDRKGEPLPTAREIMDKAVATSMAYLHERAQERKVNADGSRIETKPNRWKVSAILRVGATANKALTPSAFLIDRYGPSRVATQEHSRSHVYNTAHRATEVAADLNRAGWEAVVIPLYQDEAQPHVDESVAQTWAVEATPHVPHAYWWACGRKRPDGSWCDGT